MPDLGLVALRSEGAPGDAQPMVDAIGKLIINCGLLETFCKNGICVFEKDVDQQVRICNGKWADRSKDLKELIKQKVCDQNLRDRLIEVIEKTQDLMSKFRNSVAHGMVCDQDDEIFIFDSKFRKNTANGELNTTRDAIRIPELKQRVDEAADLVEEWVDLWEQLKHQMGTTY